jgi:hypothetical protein
MLSEYEWGFEIESNRIIDLCINKYSFFQHSFNYFPYNI